MEIEEVAIEGAEVMGLGTEAASAASMDHQGLALADHREADLVGHLEVGFEEAMEVVGERAVVMEDVGRLVGRGREVGLHPMAKVGMETGVGVKDGIQARVLAEGAECKETAEIDDN